MLDRDISPPVTPAGPYFGGCKSPLKPASKVLGLHGVFIRGKGLKYMIADSAFKRVQVDACPRSLDTGEHHRGLALRTGGALKCTELNGGSRAVRS